MAPISKWMSAFIVICSIQDSNQVPLQTVSESATMFGQRINKKFPSLSNRRFAGRFTSTIAPTSNPTSTLPSTFETTEEENSVSEDRPLEERSFFALEPITVNKTEGACSFDGKLYQSGENIERKHLCHFCFCRNGYIDCYWKNCPPAPEGCVELTYEGVCERSLYLCPIPKKPIRSTTSPRLRREINTRENFTQPLGCNILGVNYQIGELVGVATDPCLECRCALDALYCSPKCCFQPAEPDDDVAQQIQRSDGYRSLQSNPLQHLRSDFEPGRLN